MIHAVCGAYEGTVVGWSGTPEAMELAYALGVHDGSVRSVAVSESGRAMATGGADETIHVFDLRRRKEVGVLLEHTATVTCLQFVGDTHLLSGGDDGVLCIWRVADWTCVHKLGGHRGGVTSVAVHPSKKVALSVAHDRTLRLWDLVKGRIAFVHRLLADGGKVIWAPSGGSYAVLYDTAVDIFSRETGEPTSTVKHASRIHDIAFVSDGTLATGSEDGVLRLWDSATAACIGEAPSGSKRVRCVNVMDTADGKYLVSAGSDGIVQWFTLSSDNTLTAAAQLSNAVNTRITCLATSTAVAVSRASEELASGGAPRKQAAGNGEGSGATVDGASGAEGARVVESSRSHAPRTDPAKAKRRHSKEAEKTLKRVRSHSGAGVRGGDKTRVKEEDRHKKKRRIRW